MPTHSLCLSMAMIWVFCSSSFSSSVHRRLDTAWRQPTAALETKETENVSGLAHSEPPCPLHNHFASEITHRVELYPKCSYRCSVLPMGGEEVDYLWPSSHSSAFVRDSALSHRAHCLTSVQGHFLHSLPSPLLLGGLGASSRAWSDPTVRPSSWEQYERRLDIDFRDRQA